MTPIPLASELLAHQDFLRRLARGLAPDAAAAEDLVQDTWVAALQLSTPPSRPRAWLAGVLRKSAAQGARRRSRRKEREALCRREEATPTTAEIVEGVELQRVLVSAVLALPEGQREVVLRRYFTGESLAAMARRLEVPEATLRTRLRRGHDALRDRLARAFPERCRRSSRGAWIFAFGRLSHSAGEGLPGSVLSATGGWSAPHSLATVLAMKKTLLQFPWMVACVLGAGIGYGGSRLIHPSHSDPPPQREVVAARGLAPRSDHDSEGPPQLVATQPLARGERRAVGQEAQQGEAQPLDLLDWKRLLASNDRVDQARAIRHLLELGTEEAGQLLLQSFMHVEDPLLVLLLEEALLETELDLAPLMIEEFSGPVDPRQAGRLASLLTQLAAQRPTLEPALVDLFVAALEDPGPNGELLEAARDGLIEIGPGAVDAVAAFLANPHSNREQAQLAAEILAQAETDLPELLHRSLEQSFAQLQQAAGDTGLTDAELEGVLRKSQALAWATANRPTAEHDALTAMAAAKLLGTTHPTQAQYFAWTLANLGGTSPQARVQTSAGLLSGLGQSSSSELRQSLVWAVRHLAVDYENRPIDGSFDAILQAAQNARDASSHGSGLSQELIWLLEQLELTAAAYR